ncbi:MAG: CorA family divalent cation transporter [Pseudomonadales bacterium]|nr:CorA family divalent cation transporter [Pseudomonadales bacterium]
MISVLSIVLAIFLPITFITGVFGMNVAGVLGVENADAFSYVIVTMGLSFSSFPCYSDLNVGFKFVSC